MIYLGEFKATDTVFYAANFHNDTGTLEDPTSPEAQIRNSAGTWSALSAPAKQNSKTGHYGGTVDTTGFSVGQHIIRMAGTVATAKTVATEFCFTVVANIASDIIADTNDIQTQIGTAGAGLTALGDTRIANLDATVSSRSTYAGGAVASVTGNVGGNVIGSVGSVTGLTASNLDATISSRATPSQVNTEVLDVLNTDTFVEPGQGAPAATTTLATKINYIYKFLRNKITTTATEIKVYDDAGTTVDHKSTISDDTTTFTRGEFGSGP